MGALRSLRTWWWGAFHARTRYVYTRPERRIDQGYILMRQLEIREPFGPWVDQGPPHGLHGVSWPDTLWVELAQNGEVVEEF